MAYIKLPKEIKLGTFILPCNSYFERNVYYNNLIKNRDSLEVHCYVNNRFTYLFVDNIIMKKKLDTAELYVRLDFFVNRNDYYDIDDVVFMSNSIERICKIKPQFKTENIKLVRLLEKAEMLVINENIKKSLISEKN